VKTFRADEGDKKREENRFGSLCKPVFPNHIVPAATGPIPILILDGQSSQISQLANGYAHPEKKNWKTLEYSRSQWRTAP